MQVKVGRQPRARVDDSAERVVERHSTVHFYGHFFDRQGMGHPVRGRDAIAARREREARLAVEQVKGSTGRARATFGERRLRIEGAVEALEENVHRKGSAALVFVLEGERSTAR